MVNKLRALAKAVASEIGKYRLSSNITAGVNTVGRLREKLGNGQGNSTVKTNLFSKQIDQEQMVARYANPPYLPVSNPVPQRIIIWWQWYQQLTGMDMVDSCRERVISSQEKLFTYQDQRRLLNREATLMSNKLKEIYGELVQTRRDDPKYVQLTILENKSLQDQARIVEKLNLLEREERDCFTHLATAIKEYHDNIQSYQSNRVSSCAKPASDS
ncbi:hypothetical protein KM043_001420 [Ampulex compressa]|nr:hypothetical protein KM043_001420 [Ampulex compressa]